MKQFSFQFIYVYVYVSLAIFLYLGFTYLKSHVYEAGYQAAIKDIADTSLTDTGCSEWVVLGLWDEKFTYVKNLQCPSSDNAQVLPSSEIEDDFILPHLLDQEAQ